MKIYLNGKKTEVRRGDLLETPEGFFKFIGRKNENLFQVREMRIPESGKAYPVKGEKGLRFWTAAEILRAEKI